MTQHLIVAGNPVDGFTFHGPFDDSDEAYLHAETLDADWTLASCTPPPAKMMQVIDDAGLKCPNCLTVNQVIVVDISVRENWTEVEVDDGSLVLQINALDGDHHIDHYLCGNCRTRLELPEGVEEDWL